MYLVADRDGKIEQEDSFQDHLLQWMYGHLPGRCVLKFLVLPAVSVLGGRVMESGASKVLIAPFIRSHAIDMSEYEEKDYRSYNDFFTRKLRAGARKVDRDAEAFISPCDSRLSVYSIGEAGRFSIKHTDYTAAELLRDRKLAKRYAGGYIWIFRLCVDDYHRYIYVDSGRESKRRVIPGVLHTVNPAAGDRIPIYKENAREYSVVKSGHFGSVLQMEVGAMFVGRIENHREGGDVKRGEEKGNFAFGGSTVILMTQRGRVRPDDDILENSGKGIETRVKLGERVGISAGDF